MVNSNRILTVSYGTFSCTLEGFDDPFNTMKSIAEYFRDLAADDRYFGAEPPQPDAEMLHRIAEREVNRKVEARVADDGVVLRQIGAEAAAAPLAPPAAALAAAPEPAAQPIEAEPVAPRIESVAEKLARIRAAVARARATEDAMAQTYEEDEATEDAAIGSIDEAFSGPAFPEEAEVVEAGPQLAPAEEDEAEQAQTTAELLADPALPAEEAEVKAPADEPEFEASAEEVEVEQPLAHDTASDADSAAPLVLSQDEEPAAEATQPEAPSGEDTLAALARELQAEPVARDAEVATEAGSPEQADEDTLAAIAAELNPEEDAAPGQGAEAEAAELDALALFDEDWNAPEEEEDILTSFSPAAPMRNEQPESEAPAATSGDWEDTAAAEDALAEVEAVGAEDEAVAEDALAEAEDDALAEMADAWEAEDQASAEDARAEAEDDALAEMADAWVAEDEAVAEDALAEAEDDALAEMADAWEAEDEAVAEDALAEAEADALAEMADAWEAEDEAVAEDVLAEGDDDEEIEIEAESDDPGVAPHARIIRLKRSDFEAALAAGDIEEIEDEDEDDEDTISSYARAEREAAEADDAEEAARRFHEGADLPPEALIEPEDDALFSDAAQAEEADDGLEEDIRSLIGETSLSDEDEEDLLEELASVERDVQQAREVERQEQVEEAPTAADSDEDALNRLLSETNAKLGENEGSRRRSAIAHLKAAVAATRADRLLKTGREREEANALNQYRDDLAKVVRPRRPAEGAGEGRGTRGRPVADILRDRGTPLMLVSEQRVDLDDEARAAAAGPVRPRRVAARSTDDAADRDEAPQAEAPEGEAMPSFADFARKAGAHDLPDILEAAAAYATLVEGREGVSRPQILRRAASLTGDEEISREKGLQSFGALLRSGRIRKLGHGRFAVSDDAEVARMARASGE
jgi:hypothetical protein